jgi:hypothetical protein
MAQKQFIYLFFASGVEGVPLVSFFAFCCTRPPTSPASLALPLTFFSSCASEKSVFVRMKIIYSSAFVSGKNHLTVYRLRVRIVEKRTEKRLKNQKTPKVRARV